MRSTEYKRQLLEFILTAYPDGLPEGCSQVIVMTLAGSDGVVKRFNFRFDKEDYNEFLENSKNKDRNETLFNKQLTPKDVEFLQSLKINIEDGEYNKS